MATPLPEGHQVQLVHEGVPYSAGATEGGIASEETLSTVASAIGLPGDTAWNGTGAAAVIAILKAIADMALSPEAAQVVGGANAYEIVAASQTDQMLGTTGAAGDYLDGLLVIPITTSPGVVQIEDGDANTTVFEGGADAVGSLVPFFIPLGIASATGGWEITTGANVRVIAVGRFT